ncbi:MAG: hypothetical protein V1729_01805 [Candidatus Woesearchaeota archaeon]
MNSKKAQTNKPFAVVIGIVLLLSLALVVYLAFIKPSGKTAGELFGTIGSCADPLVGDDGVCSCVFADSICPGDSESKLNRNCPATICDPSNAAEFAKQSVTAQKNFDKKVKDIEKELGATLGPDQRRMLEPDFFGSCCVGAEMPK